MVLTMPPDMPFVTPDTYKSLLLSLKDHPDEVSLRGLHILFMQIGITRENTVGNHIKNMRTLGFLSTGSGTTGFRINWSKVGLKMMPKGQKKLEE